MSRSSVTLSFSLLILGGTLCAQKVSTLPPGYLNKEGGSSYEYLGRYSQSRTQIVTSGLRGKALRILAFGFRVDGTSEGGASRTWTRVTVDLSDGDASRLTSTFSVNRGSRLTRVFDKAVSWPKQRRAARVPAPWNAIGLLLPFRSPYVYTGRQDMVADFEFRGGRSANGGSVTSYSLDAPALVQRDMQSSFSIGCTPIMTSLAIGSWRKQLYPEPRISDLPQRSNKIEASIAVNQFLRVGDGLIVAVSPNGTLSTTPRPGSALPVRIGACNPLMIDLAQASYLNVRATRAGTWNSGSTLLPYSPSLVGLTLYAQSAYTGLNGRFALTGTSRARVAPQPTWTGGTLWNRFMTTPRGTMTSSVPVIAVTHN